MSGSPPMCRASEGTLSYTAGPKVTHFDRVEWLSLGDAATAVAALSQGEVDWLDSPSADQVPLLARNAGVTVEVKEPPESIAIMRFNHLYPPFNNPAIRRALLGAIDQADVMNAVAGTDRTLWHDRIGLFGPGSPAGQRGRDRGAERSTRLRQGEARPRGGGLSWRTDRRAWRCPAMRYFAPISQVGADQLRKAGMNVDLQIMDFPTLIRRRMPARNRRQRRMECILHHPRWSVQCQSGDEYRDPWRRQERACEVGQTARSWRRCATPGWMRQISMPRSGSASRCNYRCGGTCRTSRWGIGCRSTAHRRNIVDLPWGFPAFYGVRRV